MSNLTSLEQYPEVKRAAEDQEGWTAPDTNGMPNKSSFGHEK